MHYSAYVGKITTYTTSISLLPSHQHLGVSGGSFRPGFLSKDRYGFLFSTVSATFPAQLIIDVITGGLVIGLPTVCLSTGLILCVRPKYH